MAGAKSVVIAFFPARKTGNAAALTQGFHGFAPSGQNLVRVGLVAYIPDNLVCRSVVHVMQGNREFNRTKIGGQVSAGFCNRGENKSAQLIRKLLELSVIQRLEVGRGLYGFEQVQEILCQ